MAPILSINVKIKCIFVVYYAKIKRNSVNAFRSLSLGLV